MKGLAVLGFAMIVFAGLVWGVLSSSEGSPVEGGLEDKGAGLVELTEALDREASRAESAARTGGAIFEGGGEAYLEEVEAFGKEHVEVIRETGALTNVLVRQSRGLDRMKVSEAGRLSGLLSRMEEAPKAGVVVAYPEGYEDCGRHMRAAAYSLRFAASAIREYNHAASAGKLDDYSGLIGMHLQSMSSAKSCVADHLYPDISR